MAVMVNTRKPSVAELKRDELRYTFLVHVKNYQRKYPGRIHRKEGRKGRATLVEVHHKESHIHEWLSDIENFDQLNYRLDKESCGALALSGNEKRFMDYVLSFCILHDADPSYIDGFDWLMARLFD